MVGFCETGVGAMKYWENWRFTLVGTKVSAYRVGATRPKWLEVSFMLKQVRKELR